MYLSRILIQDFRNLGYVDIYPNKNINFIQGVNGAGKTSILEAISYLSLGRSFKNINSGFLINHEANEFTIFTNACYDENDLKNIGVSRNKSGQINISIDGQRTLKLIDLIDHIYTQIIHPQCHELIIDEPSFRRSYLDWGLFYHYSDFKKIFLDFKKCLAQRNALLKIKAPYAQFSYWDESLADLSDTINSYRYSYLLELEPYIQENLKLFLPNLQFSFSLYKGHSEQNSYHKVLEENFDRDINLGYTFNGCHRGDLKVKCMQQSASNILSRGQLKLLVCSMRIAQGQLFNNKTKKNCIYLIDDLHAELDSNARRVLLSLLENLNAQVFITSTHGLDEYKLNNSQLFNINDGQVI